MKYSWLEWWLMHCKVGENGSISKKKAHICRILESKKSWFFEGELVGDENFPLCKGWHLMSREDLYLVQQSSKPRVLESCTFLMKYTNAKKVQQGREAAYQALWSNRPTTVFLRMYFSKYLPCIQATLVLECKELMLTVVAKSRSYWFKTAAFIWY